MRVFRVLWPLISLPMMLSFCYVYNATRSFGSTMWRSAAKCGATFVAVITAVLGIVLFNRPANAWLLALALLLCCIADFVIERDFRFGVISFGLAHLVLIGYIAQLGGFRWGTVVAALIIYGIIALIFRQYLHSLGSMLIPMVLYPLVLSFMTAMAGTLPFVVSPRWVLFALGAAAFCISDLFVARDFICGITGAQKNGALILYYLAVYAMASIQLYL